MYTLGVILRQLYLFYYSFFSLFLLICIVIFLTILSFDDNKQFYVFAHINGSKIQEITDNSDGIKISLLMNQKNLLLILIQNFTLVFKI